MKKIVVAIEVESDELAELVCGIDAFLKTKAPNVTYEIFKVRSVAIELDKDEEENADDNSG